jgi:hypothetical protein
MDVPQYDLNDYKGLVDRIEALFLSGKTAAE